MNSTVTAAVLTFLFLISAGVASAQSIESSYAQAVMVLGRATLWIVVLLACVSMYEYFRGFYRAAVERPAEERGPARPTLPQAARTTTPNR